MSLYKRGNVWWYKFSFRGEMVYKSSKVSNKREAAQIEAAAKTRLAKGEVGIEERKAAPTLKAFAPRFEQAIEMQCASKPATVTFYKSKLRCLLANESLASSRLDVIEEAAIETYKQTRTRTQSRRKQALSPASVNRELATLRRLLRLAAEWKIIDRVPRIHLLRGEHNREFVLSQQQEPVYLAALPPVLHDVALMLLDTGLRIGEALSLEWPDVRMEPAEDAHYGYLTVRSGNAKARNVPLSGRVREMLEWIGPVKAGYVFHREDGQPLYQTWLNQQHVQVRKLLKMPADFVPHSLRHTFGTRLGESGADVFHIMKLMGHSSVTVSQRYVHPSPESIERAFGRLEEMNRRGRLGTKSGTVAIDVTANSEQIV